MFHRLRVEQFADQLFRLAHRELFFDHLTGSAFHVLWKAGESKEHFSMAKAQSAGFQSVLKRLRQLEQADEVGNAGPVLARARSDLLLRKTEFPAQPLKGLCLLYRVQILALQVEQGIQSYA